MGFAISATRGTAEFLEDNGIKAEIIKKYNQGSPNAIEYLRSGKVNLLINTPKGRYSVADDGYMRIEAVRRKVCYTTTVSAAEAAVEGIKYLRRKEYISRPMPNTYGPLNY